MAATDPCKRYPVQFKCGHCGNAGYTRKDGSPNGRGWEDLPKLPLRHAREDGVERLRLALIHAGRAGVQNQLDLV